MRDFFSKKTDPLSFLHLTTSHLNISTIKSTFSHGLELAVFFVYSNAFSQIDYGTIKLFNSLTDQEILNISNGSTYDLNVVGDSLNIVAVPPISVGSVTFSTTIGESRTESVAPYAFNGDVSGNYQSRLTLPNHLDVSITFAVSYWSASGGTGTLLGDDVYAITFTKPAPDITPPTAPSGLTSTGNTDTSIYVSWNVASDNVAVTGYKIYLDNVPTTLGNVTNHQFMGLAPSTSHDIKVRALDAVSNESFDSNVVTVTTDSGSGGGLETWSTANNGNDIYYNNGKVKIGVANPEANLHFSGNAKIEHDESDMFGVDGSGLGIGTNSPGAYRLAVKGSIRAEEIKVETGWPDYVFSEGYDLPTLEEVEKHIKEKGHLINIPSAEEVKANGIQLGEMNKLLLEKIEELTLHIIKLNKEIKTLKQNQ